MPVAAQPPFVEFTLESVDTAGDVGASASLAVDDKGRPHVAYLDRTSRSLRYAWRDEGGWHAETVGGVDVSRNCSLALEPDGTPIVVYKNGLMVESATRREGGWIHQTVGGYAPWASCVVTAKDGSVHAGFLWSTSGGTYLGHVSYAFLGVGSWVEVPLESSPFYFIPTNPQCSIAVDGELDPLLCFSNDESHELRCFERSAGAWTSSLVSYGTWSSIAVDSAGVPHVSFYDTTWRQLRIATGSSGHWSVGVVDDEGVVGQYSSLEFGPGGRAHIAYYDSTAGDLKYAHIDPFDAIWTIQVVDEEGDRGRWAALDVDSQGNVHIAYYDATKGDLRYATTRSEVAVRRTSWSDAKSMYRETGEAPKLLR